MPLLRYSLYSQNVNLYLAPTADARDTWLPLMRTVACESRAFVLSANQCMRRKNLPSWITQTHAQIEASKQESQAARWQKSRGRRSSIITKIEDNHELVLPPPGTLPLKNGSLAEGDGYGIAESSKAKSTTETTEINDKDSSNDFVTPGGSCIIGPLGQVLAWPLWEVEEGGLLIQEVDFEDCERGRLDLDVAGSYSRNDAFKLEVTGLDLNPPP